MNIIIMNSCIYEHLGGTLLYHKIYMYVPSKFTIKKDYFFHENKVKCN